MITTQDLKKLSNEQLELVINEIRQIQKDAFFKNFKLKEGKCYINKNSYVIIKVRKITKVSCDDLSVRCEFYSTFGTKILQYEEETSLWFRRDSISNYEQEEFEEITEEKYNEIASKLKELEDKKMEIKKQQNNIIINA
jgi:hypothetical protein